MKSSRATTSMPPSFGLSFGPRAVLPLMIRTRATCSVVNATPTNENPPCRTFAFTDAQQDRAAWRPELPAAIPAVWRTQGGTGRLATLALDLPSREPGHSGHREQRHPEQLH